MTNEVHIQLADWSEDSAALIAVRTEVFVEEQKVPVDMELDEQDAECLHIKAVNEDGKVIATARLLESHYIGRMCVLSEFRNQGIGGKMLAFLIELAREHQLPYLKLNAQTSAIGFYEKYGFKADSEIFLEADIEHRHMSLVLSE